jgi:polyhydroxybutyrate depolymerase
MLRTLPFVGLCFGLLVGVGFAQETPAPLASTGCTLNDEIQRGEREVVLDVDGEERRYLLYVPESLDLSQPAPLMISLHGFTSNMVEQKGWDGLDKLAEREGFIVAWGQGTGFPRRWVAGSVGLFGDSPKDVAYVSALIDDVGAGHCVDEARVYAVGFSNGGGMAYRLACQLSERIAAIGTQSGAYNDSIECAPQRGVPVIAIHGLQDPVVRYEGQDNGSFGGITPSIAEWTQAWAERNQCASTPEISDEGEGVSMTLYADCADDVQVRLMSVADGGHTWFGGDLDAQVSANVVDGHSMALDSSAVMWAFLSQYRLGK